MEQALRAIANPRRRAMLELVWDRERTATEIANLTGLSKPAASQHLRVLREAGLVQVRATGNRRLYRSDPVRMAELRGALEAFWGDRLARMRDEVEEAARLDD
ncbi:MAG: ArsR/SmtB family transcription factor [Solirubrobacteraceae bacterium]